MMSVNVMVDEGELADREFETFELFFTFDPNCGIEIDPDTADGGQTVFQLAKAASLNIYDRYAEYYKNSLNEIGTIGISHKTKWKFGKENIPELEAMIGTLEDDNLLVGYWQFYVRFAPVMDQIEGRCLAAKRDISFDLNDDQDLW